MPVLLFMPVRFRPWRIAYANLFEEKKVRREEKEEEANQTQGCGEPVPAVRPVCLLQL